MMLHEREKVVLETLQKIPRANAVLIGGYAVNAYVPPRFSIDCDLVVLGDPSKMESALRAEGFVKTEKGEVPYGSYVRYDRKKEGVSFDLLVNAVQDRESGIVFEAKLFERFSKVRTTVGRVNTIRIELRIADPEMLFAMKFVAGRRQDARDLFMLAGNDLTWDAVAGILNQKCTPELIRKRAETVKKIVGGEHYRASLQGAYGKLPDERFEACRSRLFGFLERIAWGG